MLIYKILKLKRNIKLGGAHVGGSGLGGVKIKWALDTINIYCTYYEILKITKYI